MVKALASAEAQSLALVLGRIGHLLAAGQIDAGEARALVRNQQNASEAVLASLAEVSRVAAHQAVSRALRGVTALVDKITGLPLAGSALNLFETAAR